MADRQHEQGLQGERARSASGREGLGDDQGTRVGRPDPARPNESGRAGSAHDVGSDQYLSRTGGSEGTASEWRNNTGEQSTGSGAEAAEGVHAAGGDRDAAKRKTVDSDEIAERTGSEPLPDARAGEHRSGYGGSGGAPVESSDTRRPREQMEEDV
jgi:hypothetical protein